MKIRNLKYFILLICINSCAQQKAEDTIRLIPEGYMGSVLIIFNQADGQPKEYEDDKRIYRIPDNGILKTQFKPNYGVQNHQFFYVDKGGDRTEIPFVAVQDEQALSQVRGNEKTYAYWEQALGKGEKYDPKTKELLSVKQPARAFYIGKLKDIDKDYREQLDFIFKNHKN